MSGMDAARSCGLGSEQVHGLARIRVEPLFGPGTHDEVQVVTVIAVAVDVAGRSTLEKLAVGCGGFFVDPRCHFQITHAHENVSTHVNEVCRTGRKPLQSVRAVQCVLGMRRRVQHMDIQMVRVVVLRIAQNYGCEHAQYFFRTFFEMPFCAIPVVAMPIEEAVRKKCLGIEIVRVASGQLAHGRGIFLVQARAVLICSA